MFYFGIKGINPLIYMPSKLPLTIGTIAVLISFGSIFVPHWNRIKDFVLLTFFVFLWSITYYILVLNQNFFEVGILFFMTGMFILVTSRQQERWFYFSSLGFIIFSSCFLFLFWEKTQNLIYILIGVVSLVVVSMFLYWQQLKSKRESDRFTRLFESLHCGVSIWKVDNSMKRFALLHSNSFIDDLGVNVKESNEITDKIYYLLDQVSKLGFSQDDFIQIKGSSLTTYYHLVASMICEGEYVVTVYDITNERMVLDLFKKSERRYKGIFDFSVIPLVSLDEKGEIKEISAKFSNLTGFTPYDIKGKSLAEILDSQTFCDFWSHYKSLLIGKEVKELDGYLITKSGKRVHILINATGIFNDKGGFSQSIVSINDMTQYDADLLEKKDIQTKLQSSSKLVAIGQLAAGVGHEINNPLTILSGEVTRLKQLKEQDEMQGEQLEAILQKFDNSINRISNIVDGLRKFSHEGVTELQVVDANASIQDAINFLGEIIKRSGVDVVLNLSKESCLIEANYGKLQQVLVNLIVNARDAMENQDIRVLRIQTEIVADKTVMIKFKDSGSGIAVEHMDKIFDGFFTTKEVGKGTGLGLGIVKSLVEAFGGDIEVQSEFGEWTEFRLLFPIVTEEKDDHEEENMDDQEGTLSGKVLVVDDEEGIREILTLFMEQLGLDSVEAENGMVALEKVSEQEFDYIVTDMTMPKMSGKILIHKLREMRVKSKIFVITGLVSDEISELEVDGVISKPFSIENIYAELSK